MTVFHTYIAASLDGRIARPGGGVDWLDAYPAEKFDFAAFLASVDAILMGRGTYDMVLALGDWPYGAKPALVMTSRPLGAGAPAGVEARRGPVGAVVAELEAAGHARVWVEGGGVLIRDLLAIGRIDRLELALMPLLLGDGVPLFPSPAAERAFDLVACEPAGGGVARLVYDRR